MSEVLTKGKLAKEAAAKLVAKTTEEKNNALSIIAEQLQKETPYILKENEK